MNSLSLLIVGIGVVLLGFVLQSGIIAWLLDVAGWLMVIIGVILIVIGLLQMFTGGRKSGDYGDY